MDYYVLQYAKTLHTEIVKIELAVIFRSQVDRHRDSRKEILSMISLYMYRKVNRT